MEALIDEAVTLIGESSWAAARSKLIAAEATLAGLPDVGEGSSTGRYQQRIQSLLEQIRMEENAGAGLPARVDIYKRGDCA